MRSRLSRAFMPNPYTTDYERYTPVLYAEVSRYVLGEIDLDPGSCELANRVIRAKRIYTIADNGLSLPWRGRVFCNPPYGRLSEGGASREALWFDHGLAEYEARRARAIIFLLAGDLGNKWLQDRAFCHPLCIIRGRVNFWNATSSGLHNPKGSCFVYLGPKVGEFKRLFSPLGRVWLP